MTTNKNQLDYLQDQVDRIHMDLRDHIEKEDAEHLEEHAHGEKLGYLTAKLEEVHTDLKEHAGREEFYLKNLGERVEAIEHEHMKVKTMLMTFKWFLVGIVAFITFEWTALRDTVKKWWIG